MKTITQTAMSLDKRLAAYAAVAAATIAAPAVPTADATVITNTVNLALPATADGVYLNVVTGASSVSAVAGWDLNPYLSNGVFTFFWPSATTGGGVATGAATNVYASLSAGAVISSASPFTASAGGGGPGSTINFQSTGQHILGFRFVNEATGIVNFGYAIINNSAPNGFPATLVSYSYENNGGAITVVPEPSSFMLLGLAAAGAFGVREWRKRKAA